MLQEWNMLFLTPKYDNMLIKSTTGSKSIQYDDYYTCIFMQTERAMLWLCRPNMCNVNVYTTGSEKTSTGRVGWRRACRPPACRRPPPGARARTPSGLTAPARSFFSGRPITWTRDVNDLAQSLDLQTSPNFNTFLRSYGETLVLFGQFWH